MRTAIFRIEHMKPTDKQVLAAIQELQKAKQPTTRQALANYAGITERTVSRVTKRLETAGVIRKENRGIHGLQYEVLNATC